MAESDSSLEETRLKGVDLSFQSFKSQIKFGAVFPSQIIVALFPSMIGLPDPLARWIVELEMVIC